MIKSEYEADVTSKRTCSHYSETELPSVSYGDENNLGVRADVPPSYGSRIDKNKSVGNKNFRFAKDDLVKLMIKSLSDMGYSETADLLQSESGLRMIDPSPMKTMRFVLDGSFDEAVTSLDQLHLTGDSLKNQMKEWILERKYAELVLNGDLDKALKVLNGDLGHDSIDRKHALAACLVCPHEHLLRLTMRALDICDSRQQLVVKLTNALPPEMAVPSGRLETLLLQGIAFQSLRSPDFYFHNQDQPGNKSAVTKPSEKEASPSSIDGSSSNSHSLFGRNVLGSIIRGPISSLLGRPTHPLSTSSVPQSIRRPADVVVVGEASPALSVTDPLSVLSSDQRPMDENQEGKNGHAVSLLKDISNINMHNVIPKRQIGILKRHVDEVWCLLFSPDSRYLCSSSVDGWVYLWDMAPMYSHLSRDNHRVKTRIRDEGASIDSPMLIMQLQADNGAASLPTGASQTPPSLAFSVHTLSWSSDSRYLLGCMSPNQVQVPVGAQQSAVYCWEVGLSDFNVFDRVSLVSSSNHHHGNIALARFIPRPPTMETIEQFVYSRVDSTSLDCMRQLPLYVSIGESDHMICLSDARTGSCLAELHESDRIGDLQALFPTSSESKGSFGSREGKGSDVVMSAGALVYVSDERTLKLAKVELCRAAESRVLNGSISADSSEVCYYYRIVVVSYLKFPQHIVSIGLDSGAPHSHQASRKLVLSFSDGAGCSLVAIEGNELKAKQEYRLDATNPGSFQQRYLLRACLGSVYISDEVSEASGTDGGHDSCLGISSLVASGREDGTLLLWRRDRASVLLTLSGHTGPVNDVCWAPNIPRLLASASDDRTIRFWY